MRTVEFLLPVIFSAVLVSCGTRQEKQPAVNYSVMEESLQTSP